MTTIRTLPSGAAILSPRWPSEDCFSPPPTVAVSTAAERGQRAPLMPQNRFLAFPVWCHHLASWRDQCLTLAECGGAGLLSTVSKCCAARTGRFAPHLQADTRGNSSVTWHSSAIGKPVRRTHSRGFASFWYMPHAQKNPENRNRN